MCTFPVKCVDEVLDVMMRDVLVEAGNISLNYDRAIYGELCLGDSGFLERPPRPLAVEQLNSAVLQEAVGMDISRPLRFQNLGDGNGKAVEINVPKWMNLRDHTKAGRP